MKLGVHKFSKKLGTTQNVRHHRDDMKQVLFLGLTNIRCHQIKFSHLCDLASRIYEFLN